MAAIQDKRDLEQARVDIAALTVALGTQRDDLRALHKRVGALEQRIFSQGVDMARMASEIAALESRDTGRENLFVPAVSDEDTTPEKQPAKGKRK